MSIVKKDLDTSSKKESKFIDSLKINSTKKGRKNPPIRTQICPGSGLGIQKKMSS